MDPDLAVRDVHTLEVVFGDDLVDLLFGLLAEVVVADVDFNYVFVVDQRLLQGGGVRVVDEVARNVQFLNRFVQVQKFGKAFAEHVSQ